MIEKVAQELHDEWFGVGNWSSLTYQQRKGWAFMARAAIKAMRDPSEWMKEAGAAPIRNYSQGQFPFAQTAGHAFRHMIDAALSEEKAE